MKFTIDQAVESLHVAWKAWKRLMKANGLKPNYQEFRDLMETIFDPDNATEVYAELEKLKNEVQQLFGTK